jgi:hypothetical protein
LDHHCFSFKKFPTTIVFSSGEGAGVVGGGAREYWWWRRWE